ncbi:branched-chain amino acid ABC transporter permease [Candidatus Atribacteria bacterium 1244-E10-H5-B2]|nr:MAG: branched-chain amino acid ABC transporter permease [Candidatus Atribacteria bacterium 1244-E10-H5-B2]
MKKNLLPYNIFFIIFSLIILLLLPIFMKNPYFLDIAITVLLYAFLGNAWNIVGGYCGQVSLGHAAYYGIGAYTSTILFLKFGISLWIGMIIGAVFAGVLAIILGYPSLRMKGPYFVFFTIGFAETIRVLFLTWKWVDGSRGIIIPFQDNPVNFIFFSKIPYYYIILGFLIIGMFITYSISRSKIGKYSIAIREDETMAEALGINTALYKSYTFAISASLVAIGGTFYAQYVLYIHPNDLMSLNNSIIFMLIAVAGGKGTLFGPLIGAAIIMPLWEYFRATFGGRFAGLGIVFAGSIILIIGTSAPQGIIGILTKIYAKYNIGKDNRVRGGK